MYFEMFINPLTTNVSIIKNQSGFYMMGTLVVKELIQLIVLPTFFQSSPLFCILSVAHETIEIKSNHSVQSPPPDSKPRWALSNFGKWEARGIHISRKGIGSKLIIFSCVI